MSKNTAPELLELILRTCRVPECPDVYNLGPRGHRIGFYFQQRRAILLVSALLDRLEKIDRTKIAIVGGGVTGMTALAALKSAGAGSVTVFEAADDVMSTGNAASHRLVHPNYNRWPMLGSMDSLSNLPVMNWHAGSGREVIAQLRQELMEAGEGARDGILTGCNVRKVAQQINKSTNSVEITYVQGGTECVREFDLVVVSAGFGGEACNELGLPDYWETEDFQLDRDRHSRPVQVFGIGDGGLIEIMRVCAMDPKDAWNIPLGVIGRLRPKSAHTLRDDPQKNGNAIPLLSGIAFSPWERLIQAHEEEIRMVAWGGVKDVLKSAPASLKRQKSVEYLAKLDTYTTTEEDFYRGLVRDLQSQRHHVETYLEKHLKPRASSNDLKPVLVGTTATPFEPTSAPINKLILAYLLETDRIAYKKVTQKVSRSLIEKSVALSQLNESHFLFCRFGAKSNFPAGAKARNPIELSLSDNRRNPKVERFVVEDEMEARMVDALASVTGGDYVLFNAFPDPITRATFGHNSPRIDDEVRKKYTSVVANFFKKCFADAQVQYHDANQNGPKWIVLTGEVPRRIESALVAVGGVDGSALGAPIHRGEDGGELQVTNVNY